MRCILCLSLLVLLCTLPVVATGQVCGDANTDGSVNILDLTYTLDYLLGGGAPSPGPDGDCDGVPGISISDVARLVDHLFVTLGPLDCTLSGSYSFAPWTNDTVFLPRIMAIPPEVTTVAMPIITVFGPDVDGLYMPVLPLGFAPDGMFVLDNVEASPITITESRLISPSNDTLVMLATEVTANAMAGTKELFTLVYQRQSAGNADIVPFAVDRQSPLRFAIERNGDLFMPHVIWYDYELPPDTLYINPTTVSVTMTVGDPPSAIQTADITSGPQSIAFTAITTDPWITILDVGEQTTPFTLQFEIDPEGLSAGSYTGSIDIVPSDPLVTELASEISVSLTLDPLVLYPWGDLNCDGRANLTDLTLMVGVLFLGWNAPAPCGQ